MSCCDDKPPQGQRKTGLAGVLQEPRRWMLLSAVVAAGGLAMGWDQLVVLGIAPVLVSILPCLAMCGLGLCMLKSKDKTSKTIDQGDANKVQTQLEASPPASRPRKPQITKQQITTY